jgi:hypothetical protein
VEETLILIIQSGPEQIIMRFLHQVKKNNRSHLLSIRIRTPEEPLGKNNKIGWKHKIKKSQSKINNPKKRKAI